MFIGLSNLKSLSLSGNPLGRIDPFSFLPTRSIRTLSLANCSLDTLPLAVTQCCLLDRWIWFYQANAICSIAFQWTIIEWPAGYQCHRKFWPCLLIFPISLSAEIRFFNCRVGFSSMNRSVNDRKLSWPIFSTLWFAMGWNRKHVFMQIHSPVWRLEPCTPYLWHFHLANASSLELKKRVAAWNEERMRKEGLGHCKQLYETVLEGIAMYRYGQNICFRHRCTL